ncbi:MAG TPA: class I SAM-dependent methyltransferase [Jiangellaceae bacterium]
MTADDQPGRVTPFDGVADKYDSARPGYPEDAVAWLVGRRRASVLDLGAGTGKLTRSLVAAGHDVIAVDPSEPMLDRLVAASPQVRAATGTAEGIPLPDDSVDVVTVAQAFHWFEPRRALTEIARVLRPSGHLALVWNLPDRSVGWVAELWAVILSSDEPREVERPSLDPPFQPAETATFTHEQRLDRDGLLALVASRSYVAVLPQEQRADLLAAAGSIYDAHADADGIVLPYSTVGFRSTLR